MSDRNDFFPWDDIADGNVFESGVYRFEIAAFDDGKANNGKRMPKARFSCIEPPMCKGMAYFEQFVVGTDEEPDEIVPGTMGARSMKAVFKAAQVPKNNNFAELLAGCIGNQLLIQLSKYEERDGEYKGMQRNRATGFYKIGERDVGFTADGKKGGGGASSPKPSAPPVSSAPKVTSLICTTCGKSVPREEYSAHVENCQG